MSEFSDVPNNQPQGVEKTIECILVDAGKKYKITINTKSEMSKETKISLIELIEKIKMDVKEDVIKAIY